MTYGCQPWTPLSTCKNVHPGGPIPKGSKACCGKCHQTGIEGHPAFNRFAFDKDGDRLWVDDGSCAEPRAEAPGVVYVQHAQYRDAMGPPKTNREQREENDLLMFALKERTEYPWTVKEIAKKFGITAGEVKAGIARARVIVELAA